MSDAQLEALLAGTASSPAVRPMRVAVTILAGCLAVTVVVTILLSTILLPTVLTQLRSGTRGPRLQCVSRLNHLTRAVDMYVEDHDGHYPLSETWQDQVGDVPAKAGKKPDPKRLICPAAPELPTGYAYNAALHGLAADELEAADAQPVLFDSTLGRKNGSDRLESFAIRHRSDGPGLAGIIAYADGHVKAVSSAPPASAGLRRGAAAR